MEPEAAEIAALREKVRELEQQANRWWAMHLKAEADIASECVRLRTRVRELEVDNKAKDAALQAMRETMRKADRAAGAMSSLGRCGTGEHNVSTRLQRRTDNAEGRAAVTGP
jgi:alcohol dehydrogenase YqhD (iron-dependent ADH family)